MILASKSYRAGSMYEYQIAWYLRMSYFYVIRAYASQGVADLVAVPPANEYKNYRALLIQAKSTKRGDWLGSIERDKMNYLESYTGGEVVLAYKNGKLPRFRSFEDGYDATPEEFLRDRYKIVGADWNTILRNYKSGKRPLHLFPPPVDENNRVISPFQDPIDVGSWSVNSPISLKQDQKSSQS